MSYVDDCITGWREASAFSLSVDAGCASPDNSESPGAVFLTEIRDAVLTAWEAEPDGDDYSDDASRIAGLSSDGGVFTIWTSEQWATWSDLAMWQEDLSEILGSSMDVESIPNLPVDAAGMIGERLALVIFDSLIEARDQDEADDDSEDDDNE